MMDGEVRNLIGGAGKDAFLGVVFALAGLLLLVWIIPAETIPGDDEELSQAFMPSVAAWLFMACGVFLALKGLVHMRVAGSEPATLETSDADATDLLFAKALCVGSVALFGALLAIYVLGFLVGGALAIFAFVLAFDRTRLLGGAVIAIAVPPVLYALAWHGLRLALP